MNYGEFFTFATQTERSLRGCSPWAWQCRLAYGEVADTVRGAERDAPFSLDCSEALLGAADARASKDVV